MRIVAAIMVAACLGGEAFAQTTREVEVYFGANKAELTDEAQAVVNEARSIALNCDATAIRIVGHDDTAPAPEASRRMSLQRAENVRELMLKGDYFKPEIVAAEGHGQDELVIKTGPGVKEPQNRRVVIAITCK